MSTLFDTIPIGARVVVRARLDPRRTAEYGGPSMTDAVGELIDRDAETVTVSTRHGDVTIERARIVAAKQIPPRPTRRGRPHRAPTVAELHRITGPAWGALEREALGDWELRASAGWTQRGNSVLPVGSPGVPLSEAVDRIQTWYAVRGLPPRVCLAGPVGFDPADDPLGTELLDRGWTPGGRTLNLTASTETIAAADPGGPEVRISRELDDDWLAANARSRAAVPEVTPRVLLGSPDQLFASIAIGGGLAQQLGLSTPGARSIEPVAIGRLGLAHGWAGLGAVWVDPDYRGRGLAAHLTGALAAQARADGIHLIHLQVEADNDAAIRLYERLGFEPHSSYIYLTGAAPG